MIRVLVVEDDAKLAKLLVSDLKLEGYAAQSVRTGEEGLALATSGSWNAIVLDVTLPGIDGFEVCRRLRAERVAAPILFLTARSQDADKLVGFQVGADDYLAKPFNVLELLARLKALLRRTTAGGQKPDLFESGPWRIDFVRHEAWRGKTRIDLTTKEFQLLQWLISRRGHVVTREEFLRELWQYDEMPSTRTVDNQVASLRRKLGWDENNRGPRILTVHQSGYRFAD